MDNGGRLISPCFASLVQSWRFSLVASQVVLWRYPHAVTILAKGIEAIRAVAAQIPGLTAVFLALVVLVKTVLQLSLYLIG